MCLCGKDPTTPFCGDYYCDWPESAVDSNIAITEFLVGARHLALAGLMTFKQYLDLVVEFDPNDPDTDLDDYEDDQEGGDDDGAE